MGKLAPLYLHARQHAGHSANDLDAAAVEAALLELTAAIDASLPFDVVAPDLAGALGALPPAVHALPRERAEELAVALGCAAGEADAFRVFDERYMATARAALGPMKIGDALADDVLQEVRRKMLTGDPPKLLRYAGRGSLRGLLKVSATRAAISALRKLERERPGDEALLDRTAERDPELAFLKEHYRGAFRQAFEAAVGSLSARERNLLRLHFMRHVTLEALAGMYGVHRATVVRRLAAARKKIEQATRKELGARLEVDRAELDGVMALIRSRMDVSVDRLLATVDESTLGP